MRCMNNTSRELLIGLTQEFTRSLLNQVALLLGKISDLETKTVFWRLSHTGDALNRRAK